MPEQHSSPDAHGQSVRRQQRSALHSIDPPLVEQHSPPQAHLPPAGTHAQLPSLQTPVQQSSAVRQAPPICSQHLPCSHAAAQQWFGPVHAAPLGMQQIPMTTLQLPEQHSASAAHIQSSGAQQVAAALHVSGWQQGAAPPHPLCAAEQQTPPWQYPSQHSSESAHDRPEALQAPQRPALQ